MKEKPDFVWVNAEDLYKLARMPKESVGFAFDAMFPYFDTLEEPTIEDPDDRAAFAICKSWVDRTLACKDYNKNPDEQDEEE